jgi:hypothetical protein
LIAECQASRLGETWHHPYGEAWWWQHHVQDLRLGQRFTFQQDNDPKHTAKTTQEWLRDKSPNPLEWPSQSPVLNLIEHLWRDLKIAVKQRSPSNLTELERICREEWEKLPKYRCAKFVASYPKVFQQSTE